MNRSFFVPALFLAGWIASSTRLAAQTTVTEAYGVRVDVLKRVLHPTAEFFEQESPLCCVVRLKNVNVGDRLRAAWIAVAEGEKNQTLVSQQHTLALPDERVPFFFEPPNRTLKEGNYKVEVLLNDKPAKTVSFVVRPEEKERFADFWPLAPAGASKARVTIRRDPWNRFTVGFFEAGQGGAEADWRAAGWMAPIVSAGLTRVSLPTLRVSYEDEWYRSSGPSAGGLTTAAVLSALRGEPMRSDAAMTGTINPDGTIGPVGGIPNKIEAAARAGKKLVLVPRGQRRDRDLRTRQMVDVVEHGRRLHVEVREVGDMYAAYHALTGKELPKLGKDEQPEITNAKVRARLEEKTEDWLGRYEQARASYQQLPKEGRHKDLDAWLADAQKQAQQAESYLREGVPGAALAKAYRAAMFTSMALLEGRLLAKRDANEALQELRKHAQAIGSQWSATVRLLEGQKYSTMGELESVLTAWSWLVKAQASYVVGQRLLTAAGEKPKATDSKAAERMLHERILHASSHFEFARSYVLIASDSRDIHRDLGGLPLAKEMPLAVVADLCNMAADANLKALDALFDGPHRLPYTIQSDPIYEQARTHGDVAEDLHVPEVLRRPGRRTPEEASPLALGRAITAYAASSALIAKYYSLGAKQDSSNRILGFERERAFLNMLDLADSQVKRSINLLQQNKIDATCCVVLYESARQLREGDLQDKFDGLYVYWMAFTQSRALAYLAGIGREDKVNGNSLEAP